MPPRDTFRTAPERLALARLARGRHRPGTEVVRSSNERLDVTVRQDIVMLKTPPAADMGRGEPFGWHLGIGNDD